MLKINRIIIAFVVIHLHSINIKSQTSLSLKQALTYAKQNNPILKTESFNVGIAEADIVTAKLRPNPILNNQSLQLINSTNYFPNTQFIDGKNRQVWWQVTKQFQLPSQRKYKIEAVKQKLKITRQNYIEIERTILLNVANNWIDAWYAKLKLDLINNAQIKVDSILKQYQFQQKKYETNTDELKIQLELNRTKIQLALAKVEYVNQLNNLKFLLNKNDSITIDTTNSYIQIPLLNNLKNSLNFANLNHSEILLAQNSLELTISDINLQKANAKPIPELGIIYNPQNTIPYIGVFGTLQLSIFSRNQGEIQKSKIMKEQAEQNLITVKQQLSTEITKAYNYYQTQQKITEDYKVIIDFSEKILILEKTNYLNSKINIVDYLEAVYENFETQKIYAEYLYNNQKNYIQLLYLTGLISQL